MQPSRCRRLLIVASSLLASIKTNEALLSGSSSNTATTRCYHHHHQLSPVASTIRHQRSPFCIYAASTSSSTSSSETTDSNDDDVSSKEDSLEDFVDPQWMQENLERFMGLSSEDDRPDLEFESEDDDDDAPWVSTISKEESLKVKSKSLAYLEQVEDADLTELKEELQQVQLADDNTSDDDDDDEGPAWVLKDGQKETELSQASALEEGDDEAIDEKPSKKPVKGIDEVTGEYLMGAYVPIDINNPPDDLPELEFEPPDLVVDWSDTSGFQPLSTPEERLDVEEKVATYIPIEERGRGRRGKRKTKRKQEQLLETLRAKREGREIPVFEDQEEEKKKKAPPKPEKVDPKLRLAEKQKQKERVKAERPNMEGTSWMQKNRQFSKSPDKESKKTDPQEEETSRSFREDFRGTRVFVQNIPPYMDWPELKDHFSLLGNVVYASVSIDRETGESKGVGVVQYETTDMAQRAILEMRDHPLADGTSLFVREDVQEGKLNAKLHFKAHGVEGSKRAPTLPQTWKPADEDTVDSLSREQYEEIRKIMKKRDNARKVRDYDTSDLLRDELKQKFRVYLDDRVKLWWVAREDYQDGELLYNDLYGSSGRRGGDRGDRLGPWSQIETTPEQDALVDPDEVDRLLSARDRARRAKNFAKADRLLEEATHAPNDPHVVLRIHDESRTWRIWVDDQKHRETMGSKKERKSPGELCMEIVREHAPHKVDELAKILEAFPGREYKILKSVKKQYLGKQDNGGGRLSP